MTALTQVATGNFNTASTWSPAQVPTAADACTGASPYTLTIDATTCVCESLTMPVGSTLACATGANTKLIVEKGIAISGALDIDLSGSATYSTEIYWNNASAASGSDARFDFNDTATGTLKGFPRTRWTSLNGLLSVGATSATVDNADGWQTGDDLVLGTTDAFVYGGVRHAERLSGVTVSGLSVSWTGGIAYARQDAGFVGNLTSNVILGPAVNGDKSSLLLTGTLTPTDVCFKGMNESGYSQYGVSVRSGTNVRKFVNCVFDDFVNRAVSSYQPSYRYVIDTCIFYTSSSSSSATAISPIDSKYGYEVTNSVIFKAFNGIDLSASPTSKITDTWILETKFGVGGSNFVGATITGGGVLSTEYAVSATNGAIVTTNLDMGDKFGAKNYFCGYASGYQEIVHNFPLVGVVNSLLSTYLWADGGFFTFANKNNDATLQETYTNWSATVPTLEWDATGGYGGEPCWVVNTSAVVGTFNINWSVFAVNDTVTLTSGRVLRDNAQPVTITQSGLGLTPVSYTCTGADDVSEQWSLQITNDSGNSGTLPTVVTITSGNVGTVCLSDYTQPPSVAINTGNMTAAENGKPVSLIISNFTSAADVMNSLTSTGTVVGSYGKMFVDMDADNTTMLANNTTILANVAKVLEAHFNRRKHDREADTITIYDSDNVTPKYVFDAEDDLTDITPQ